MSWVVVGAWPNFDEVERGVSFEPNTVHRNATETLLSVGDSDGVVKLVSYPCISKQVCMCLRV